ncbi:hypothetical protein [Thiohalophilus sp.]|uniref:hypothetical protein n=1 Tax=Thiohalophilus sp. TaxID=3028392 RepID=UPI002ACD8CD2|nr:hypothetical protein [Thiohalophilus sp.]MDZ7662533.1 hypothetical protein [Thiohalophilus sp.]
MTEEKTISENQDEFFVLDEDDISTAKTMSLRELFEAERIDKKHLRSMALAGCQFVPVEYLDEQTLGELRKYPEMREIFNLSE